MVLFGGAGLTFAYYNIVSGNLHEDLDANLDDVLINRTTNTDPFYVLLMGVDRSEERAASAEFAGDSFRSDSIILARIDPGNTQATLVSIHRDTYIDMGQHGKQKINAAHSLGGASYTVEVISKFAGVPISHYAEIDFDGLKGAIDALGGIEVDVPVEIDDTEAGGYLAAGPQTLTGDQALILCRSRHAYDDIGDGDLYRAANQRLVISALARKILSADLVTMASTITTLSQYVTTDLKLADIVVIAQSMQGFDPDTNMYSGMEPTTSQYIDETWYEFCDTVAWEKMMSRVDQGLPPTGEEVVDESTGIVMSSVGES